MSDCYRFKLKFDEYGTRRVLSDRNIYKMRRRLTKTLKFSKTNPFKRCLITTAAVFNKINASHGYIFSPFFCDSLRHFDGSEYPFNGLTRPWLVDRTLETIRRNVLTKINHPVLADTVKGEGGDRAQCRT